MNQLDLTRKFNSILPVVREWIEKTLEEHQDQAVPVINLDFSRIRKVFPPELLNRAKAVVVNGKVPFPPLSDMGFPEFAQTENMNMIGVTYKDTFFVSNLHQTESLYFHELVHIIQWERLGVDDFLLAYAVGLMQFGYADSPFEEMAYSLQANFDKNALPDNIVEVIQDRTDAIWKGINSLFPKD
ncbi:MAG: hypothetical protein MUP22_11660 [Desulfobacterales bacterium]|nr:hypothetical protein [Desulfobacterales bacterium]